MSYQKFGNKPTVVNGIKFQSKLESDRFQQLLWLEKAEEITGLVLQPEFQILKGYRVASTGEKVRSRFYIADFMYFDTRLNKWIVEDTKGMETSEFRLKWDVVRSEYPEYEFRKVTRDMV